MTTEKTVRERIRELEEERADAIKKAQEQPGLPEMEIVYGGVFRRRRVDSHVDARRPV